MTIEIKLYGVRGSMPLSHKNYLKYGGNTSCITVRTPENSLLFLDAGSGLLFAQNELEQKADAIWALLSHTHADHIIGLGLSSIAKLSEHSLYQNEKLRLIGPKNFEQGLKKLFDGDRIWPVAFNPNSDSPNLPDIDYDNILECTNNFQEKVIDSSTKVTVHQGNHPVSDGSLLFKLTIEDQSNSYTLVYATDNEFDHDHNNNNFENLEEFESSYKKFIYGVDLLIADAQYSIKDYENFKGYGHSYPERILEIANESKVKRVIFTHHHSYSDEFLDSCEQKIRSLVLQSNYKIKTEFAKEGTSIII